MKPVRTVARVMLSAIFVSSGIKVLLDPDSRAESAGRVTGRVGPWLEKVDPRLPTDTRTLIRIKGVADVVAGALLASGHLTRPAAGVLAAGLVPTTVAGHAFWAVPAEQRAAQRTQFLKNLGLLGGLLLAAADTEGRPGLAYRTTHAVDRSQRGLKRAVRTARREAKIATMSAAAGRKLG
ncbi:DoxX family protein [Actinoplanes sp. NPDC089786]|uniref:DoxX family protein n=1 Tax=Actinoplanes sp. NPDC089786 TaxID=3155185 RepID=UPI003445835E